MTTRLPEFQRPPVVEVALSVQCERLDAAMPQLALVWQCFRERFPRLEEKPELEPAFERFGPNDKKIPGVRFEFAQVPALRLWFMNDAGSELVQVQRDRFIRNWRKTDGEPNYPRYASLRMRFLNDWEVFSQFVSSELGQELLPNQCEITYVNIIDSNSSSRIDSILACMSGTYSDDFLTEPDEMEVKCRFPLLSEAGRPWGRLYIAVAPALRAADDKPVIRLSLTARGNPESRDLAGAMQALDAGHEAVVRGFTSITTNEMHKTWGRQQ